MSRNRIRCVAALALLLSAAPGLAQMRTVWETFEHRSKLDADDPANHPLILDETRLAVLDAFAPAWLAQPGGADERLARRQALEDARHNPRQYVTLQVKHGPFVRIGTRGYVSVRAEVQLDELQRLYEQQRVSTRRAPRYKVLVLISEYKVVGVPRYVCERNRISKTATAIEHALTATGWTVIHEEQLEMIRQRQLDYARLDRKTEREIATIAKEQGADIVLRGTVKAEGPRNDSVDQRLVHFFSVDCTLTAAWADTGTVIFGVSKPPGQRTCGTREAGLNGAERAIEVVAEELGQHCAQQLAAVATLPRDLQVVVTGVHSLDQEDQVRAWFDAVAGQGAVRGTESSGGRLWLTLSTDLSPYEFASRVRRIADASAADFHLQQDDRSANSVRFSVRSR